MEVYSLCLGVPLAAVEALWSPTQSCHMLGGNGAWASHSADVLQTADKCSGCMPAEVNQPLAAIIKLAHALPLPQ